LRINYVIAFLLGVIASLLGVIVFGNGPMPTFAQTSDSGGGFVAATANAEAGGKNILWLLNATERNAPRLCVYEAKEGKMTLAFSRNLTYDFMYDQYPGRADAHIPSVSEVYKETKQKRDEERKAAQPTGGTTGSPPGK
jgi:hypothetical protein